MSGRVQDKVALITGAGRGIGKACALLLAKEGAKVAVTDRDEAPANEVAAAIAANGGAAIAFTFDVSDEAAWDEAVAKVAGRFGRLDILVNNAGVGHQASIEDETFEGWKALQAINYDGVFLGTRAGVRAMKQSGGGSIVNISSIEGLIGDPMLAAYNASKGGVRLLTKSAALHCAKMKIRVNSVHPGYIDTPMVQNAAAATPDARAFFDYLKSLHPVGHLGEPDDIAYGVLYLASDESKFVTGAELVIDGGYTAQ